MKLFKSLRVRLSQGQQTIPDLRTAVPTGFRGLPVLGGEPCGEGCSACRDACPTRAIELEPLRLDLGRCVFCGHCEEVCPGEKIRFTAEPKMASLTRAGLTTTAGGGAAPRATAVPELARVFGRSLRPARFSARSMTTTACLPRSLM